MTIPEIKSQNDIIDVAQELGVQIEKGNKACCPFHEDKTPSLQFSKERQIATCFSGNCDAGTMDVIDFVSKHQGISQGESIQYLSQRVGNNPVSVQPIKEKTTQSISISEVFKGFESEYLASPKGRIYLEQRALVGSEKLQVGFNSGSFHKEIEDKAGLEALGLIKKYKNGYSVLGKDCVVFPLKDRLGNIVSLYYRSVNPETKHKHFYSPNRKGIYPSYPKPSTEIVVFTESIIDCATFSTWIDYPGETHVLALYGTNGLTAEHVEALEGLKYLEEICFFLDGDEAGEKAVQQYSNVLHELFPGVTISQIETPKGEDVNSIIPQGGEKIMTRLAEERRFLFSEEENQPSESVVEDLKEDLGVRLDTKNPNRLIFRTGLATYEVRGGIRKELDSLKVTLVITSAETGQKSRNKLDLYEDKQTDRVARESGDKLGLRPDLLENELYELTDLLDNYRESLTGTQEDKPTTQQLTAREKEASMRLLKSPNLLSEINVLIGKSGVVGEENNRLFLFGIASSYKMPDTLHALIQGSSGSGKTHLLASMVDFMPKEDVISLTRITESSLYNYGENELSHKLIGIEDYDGLEEKAELAFRELQSKGSISSSTSGKNEYTGEISGFVKTVNGPISSLSATTRGEVYEDNMSRCFIVAVDESQEQTQRIIKYQNKRASGKIDKQSEREATELLRNTMRLLKPYEVINRYADKIELPKAAHKIRRLNDLFQSYVRQITLLNQYQRSKTSRGELLTEKEDIAITIEIMFESILLKVDELDGSLRLFYEELKDYVKSKGREYEFSRLEIRQGLRLSKTQQHNYLNQLLELEYIYQSGGYVNKGFRYKINHWDNNEKLRSGIRASLNKQLEQL